MHFQNTERPIELKCVLYLHSTEHKKRRKKKKELVSNSKYTCNEYKCIVLVGLSHLQSGHPVPAPLIVRESDRCSKTNLLERKAD